MRIQNKLKSLINKWVILVAVSWLGIIILAINVLAVYSENQNLGNYCKSLANEIKRLEKNRAQLMMNKQMLGLEEERLSTILAGLTAASKRSKVSLGEISVREESEREGYKILPITLSVKGNYNQIGKFINIIEREEMRLQFWDVRLSTKETKGRGIICTMKGEFIIL